MNYTHGKYGPERDIDWDALDDARDIDEGYTDEGRTEESEGKLTIARKWPTLAPTALHGTAGDIVRGIAPHTEADPAALLVTLLSMFGMAADRKAHILAANSEHPARIWPLIVGSTSTGAKGTSASTVEAVMRAAWDRFDECTKSGLSSAEGLIEQVRDGNGKEPDDKDFEEGVEDKRLLIIESEFAAVLSKGKREGNALMPTLRDAWDGKTLRTLTRGNPLRATGHHIAVIGHVTPGELRAKLSASELAGGSINRQLITLSRRAQELPDGGNIPTTVLNECAKRIETAIASAKLRGEMVRTDAARDLWRENYGRLVADRGDGAFAHASARAIPQVLRLSLTYALMDSATEVGVEHVRAALALWDYCEASAAWLFSDALHDDRQADRGALVEFIRAGKSEGVTRSAIYAGHFKGNRKSREIDEELRPLLESGAISQQRPVAKSGRPITRYFATDLRIQRNNPSGLRGRGNTSDGVSTDLRINHPQSEELLRNSVIVRNYESSNTCSSDGLMRKYVNTSGLNTNGDCDVCGKPLTVGQTDRHMSCESVSGGQCPTCAGPLGSTGKCGPCIVAKHSAEASS